MIGKCWEDVNVGDKFVTGGKTITESALTISVGLAGAIEPLFVDEEYAKKTHFKGLVVPGPLTMFMMLGLWQQLAVFYDTAMGLISFDKVRFTAPVRPRDTIKVELEITDKRETSKPDRGLLSWHWTCKNQRDEVVVEMDSANLVRRRNS